MEVEPEAGVTQTMGKALHGQALDEVVERLQL